MVPPPKYNSLRSAFDAYCETEEKPRFQACKSLFGRSDPMETRRMLNATFSNEDQRFRQDWEFDPSWANNAVKSVAKPRLADGPGPTERRFEWELLDGKSVPQFYIRGPRKHHSETCDYLEQRRKKLSPMPLACRDENASPTPLSKSAKKTNPSKRLCRGLKFASPPKIIEGNINKSLARFVTALRVPLPTFCDVTPQTQIPCNTHLPESGSLTSRPKDVRTRSLFQHEVDPIVTTTQPALECVQTTVKPSLNSATTGSKRQLFACPVGDEKRRKDCKGGVQRTLTEMLPCKKSRPSTSNSEFDKSEASNPNSINLSQTPSQASQ